MLYYNITLFPQVKSQEMIMKLHKILLLTCCLLISNQSWALETKGIIVTIKPLHSLVSSVMGNTGTANLLLEGNTSPHDFHLKPSQIKNLQEANVVFYIDDSFETFLHDGFETLPNHVRKVALAQEANLIVLSHRESGAWDAHKHEAHEHTIKEHHHNNHNKVVHEEEHHTHEHHDMHVWLDPENARRMVITITKILSTIYPENRTTYKANARATIEKINSLDNELKKSLKDLKNKPFIVFHDAYQYLEHAYGLSGVGSITFEPDESPSPNRIKEVRKKIIQTNAQCVFREPQFSDRLIATVTEGTNAISGTLDPLGTNLNTGETLYFNLMRNLAKNLNQCLQ